MATKSQFTVNNYSQKICFWQGLIVTPWEHISLLTSELFVKWVFKSTVSLVFNIILSSFDHFQFDWFVELCVINVHHTIKIFY